MKIVVTGGAGFIGSNLALALLQKGHDVTVLDNFSLGSEKNLSSAKGKIKLVKGDIRDEKLIREVCKGADVIFNEAAASSSPMFMKNLKDAVSVNVEGFINILNAARDSGVKRVIYASTSVVYGNRNEPLNELMETKPSNFYAATKLMNENLAGLFGQEYGLETVGFRYMSIYGPNEESKGIYANLVSQFLWAMAKGEQPVIYGDGKQTRDFTYVKDVVEANILAMESKKKMVGEIFNIGTGRCWSLNELVQILNKFLKKSIKPKYVEMPVKNYMGSQVSDNRKISSVLGFKPAYMLEDGIREMTNMK